LRRNRETAVPRRSEALVPAVPSRKFVSPGFLNCLDDGKKFKSLKRHLASRGMTPDQYRAKWNLPKDYPMVAPDYSATRSALAKKIGLGQLRKDTAKRKPGRTSKRGGKGCNECQRCLVEPIAVLVRLEAMKGRSGQKRGDVRRRSVPRLRRRCARVTLAR
jgi:predicted transcriptional regulator